MSLRWKRPPCGCWAYKDHLHRPDHELFQTLYREMEARGLRQARAAQLLFLGEEFNYESMDVEAQVAVSGTTRM